MNTLCRTRKEAKIKNDKFYFTGKPCRHGHIDNRLTSSAHCVQCAAEYNKAYGPVYYAENKSRLNDSAVKYREDNKVAILAGKIRYYQNNKASHKKRSNKWNEANRDRKNENGRKWKRAHQEQGAKYGAKWRSENPDKGRAKTARRRASILMRSPVWLSEDDHEKINSLYSTAVELTKSTNVSHHVDHIIPLQGRFVSGLHVPDNLQILTAYANLSKGNKFNIIKGHI